MQSMLPTFNGRNSRSSQPRARTTWGASGARRPLMQSAVRHVRQVPVSFTRSSSGDIVEAMKLNWPIGQRYLQKEAPVKTVSTTSAEAKYARTRYAVAPGSAHRSNSS